MGRCEPDRGLQVDPDSLPRGCGVETRQGALRRGKACAEAPEHLTPITYRLLAERHVCHAVIPVVELESVVYKPVVAKFP